MSGAVDVELLRALWRDLGGAPDDVAAVALDGPESVLPSVYRVTALASASIGLAALAAATLAASRRGTEVPRVTLHRTHAALAFRCEAYVEPIGWEIPPPWDPIAGDYETRDGWIRLHTNYAHHRDPALRVLGVAAERDAVAAAVARWQASELEQAIVDAGGCAAAMRDVAAWRTHPQGRAVAAEPVLALPDVPADTVALAPHALPLGGVRVLDLTRVIAGPVCTGFLAEHGAEVLRLDPPGFAEVGALLPVTTAGKRRAFLDLRTDAGRARFLELVRTADVLVCGYRAAALSRLGLDDASLRRVNPSLVVAALDAYGWSGPWSERRGFDSLVQMSCGIAARGQEAYRSARPHPLPAQALDHATGYLLAAGVCRALARRREGVAVTVRASLARTARLLIDLGEGDDASVASPGPEDVAPWLETVPSTWGPMRRLRPAGAITGTSRARGPDAGPLGSDPPAWSASA